MSLHGEHALRPRFGTGFSYLTRSWPAVDEVVRNRSPLPAVLATDLLQQLVLEPDLHRPPLSTHLGDRRTRAL